MRVDLRVALRAAGRRTTPWLIGIASYYAVLFVCSIAGLTPAPLLGFGAGPVIGFGLVVGIAPMLRKRHRISHLTRPDGLPDSNLP